MRTDPHANISIYEEDLEGHPNGPFPAKYISVGFVGTILKVAIRPGKRPRRKPGESPLEPPRK